MKILHVLRDATELRPLETALGQRSLGEVTVLLLQEAVFRRDLDAHGLKVYACHEDVAARAGLCPYPTLDYDGILELVAGHDRVICW